MKNILVLAVMLLIACRISAQSELLYVSPKADSLSEALLQNSSDYDSQINLMNEYIEEAHPELGLLDILDLENGGKITSDNSVQNSKILFWLERGSDAVREFVRAYLYDPKPELIRYLIVSDYAAGNKARSLKLLKKYSAENADLPMEIAHLYQELYLNKRYRMASASQSLLLDFDKNLHNKLFPIPSIFVLSGENELYSTEDEITITFEIRHGVQIKTISINSDPIYKPDENMDIDAKTPFSKTFNKTIKIHSGINQIIIETEDVYGYRASQNIEVKGLKFNKTEIFAAPLADTLSLKYRLFDSYIPSDSTDIDKDKSGRAVFFSPIKTNKDVSADLEFWYRFVTNGKTGKFAPANIKFLTDNEADNTNFDLIFDKWLMKEVNFQTTALFFLNGTWKFSEGKLLLNSGIQKIDPAKYIKRYSSKISKGLYMIFYGASVQDSSQLAAIKALIDKAGFPIEIMAVEPDGFRKKLVHDFTSPADSVDSLYTSAMNFQSLADIYPQVTSISNKQNVEFFTKNPAQTIRDMHGRLFAKLEQSLKAEKLEKKKIEVIMDFCKDWRRYGEMKRFYDGIITGEDLFVQADEFFSRNSGGEDEN